MKTVKQLIEELNTFSQDLHVVVNGYEWGYDDVDRITVIRINRDTNLGIDIAGKHDEADKDGIKHLYIGSSRR